MQENEQIIFRGKTSRSLVILVCALMALGANCPNYPQVQPATPTLISITGHGTFDPGNPPIKDPSFKFDHPVRNGGTITHFTEATVTFSVPYPTSLELAIVPTEDQSISKPLTKVDPALLSDRYTYTGSITNPGNNPATWTIVVRKPFDTPLYTINTDPAVHTATYILRITDVSGSTSASVLSIRFRQEEVSGLQNIIPPIWTAPTDAPIVHKTSDPGHCGVNQTDYAQTFDMCFKAPGSTTERISASACSYDEALGLFSNGFPTSEGWTNHQGPCASPLKRK